MNFVCAIVFLLLSLISTSLCSTDENCVWNYKCCIFKETNGQVVCDKMCEPEITCKEEPSSHEEEIDPYAPLEIKSNVCREGYQHRFGRCRRVMMRKKTSLNK
jgi:hypothetical protein